MLSKVGIEVVDAHAHFFTANTLKAWSLRGRTREGFEQRTRSRTDMTSIELPDESTDVAQQWVDEMDRYGITAMGFMVGAEAYDEFLEAKARFPGRFMGYANINPGDPEAAEKVDEAAVARVAAWEAAFGIKGKQEEKTQQPPPLKGRSAPAAQPPPVPAEKKETPGPTSVVVDWMELGEEKESEDTEEIRPGKEPVPEEPVTPEPFPAPPVSTAAPVPQSEPGVSGVSGVSQPSSQFEGEPEPEEEEPTPVRKDKIPTLVVEKEEEEQTEPEKPVEEVLTGQAAIEEEEVEEEEEKTAKEIAIPPDTIQMPQAAVPRKKFPWKIVAILAVVVVAVLAVVFWPKDEGQARDDGAGASPVAFLSVHTSQPAKVTLDGELLAGGTPVKDKVLRAGKHRVIVDSLDGTRLMDEVIVLVAGEHKDIRVVIAAAQRPAEPPAEVKPEKPAGKKVRKKKKKRVRRKRRRTRK